MTQYSGKVIRKTPVTPTQQSASGVWKLNEQAAAIRNNSWPVPGVPNPISRSVRFRSSASAYFNRTPASAGNRTIWTWSGWIKRGALGSSRKFFLGTNSTGGTNSFYAEFNASDVLNIGDYVSPSYVWQLTTTQVFRDPSAWYHLVICADTTQATSSNRIKVYVNGAQVTAFSTASYPTQNYNTIWNSATLHTIGDLNGASLYFDGYMTEINFIDGQALTPSSFGTTDTATGAWIPMPYTGTYGTNGFYLNFKDNTSTTTIGYDYSGNANNWTANNISLTAGSTYDSMLDVPTPWVGYTTTTDTSAVTRGNYATWNSLWFIGSSTFSSGNLIASCPANNGVYSTFAVTTGKWYAEVTPGGSIMSIGVSAFSSGYRSIGGGSFGYNQGDYAYLYSGNKMVNNGTQSAYGSTFTTNDVIGIAIDADAGTVTMYKNNVSQGAIVTGLTGQAWVVAACSLTGTLNMTLNNGAGSGFAYTPPTGYKAFCTTNLTTPAITNGANYMAATTYTGTGSSLSVSNGNNNTTGVTFKPDLVWIKDRTTTNYHVLFNSIVGGTNYLCSNATQAETGAYGNITFNSNGFTESAGGTGIDNVGTNAHNYVAWQWQAGAGSSSSNTSGSITSTVSVNTTAGFSVVTYTTASANATVGHGLGIAPNLIIVKCRNTTIGWTTYHVSLGNTQYVQLNTTAAAATDATAWNNTSPTSSVFSLGTAWGSNNYVAYCWAAVAGYSAFGSYTGNGSSDGPFIYCGFRPRWVMIKRTDSSTNGDWEIKDSSRSPYNAANSYLYANLANAEGTSSTVDTDFCSNGFKLRATYTGINANGGTYIYAAFAENPFKYSNAR